MPAKSAFRYRRPARRRHRHRRHRGSRPRSRCRRRSLGNFTLQLTTHESGAICYQRTGADLPADTLDACRQADAVLLGAMGHPDIRKPDGTELTPQVTLRIAARSVCRREAVQALCRGQDAARQRQTGRHRSGHPARTDGRPVRLAERRHRAARSTCDRHARDDPARHRTHLRIRFSPRRARHSSSRSRRRGLA